MKLTLLKPMLLALLDMRLQLTHLISVVLTLLFFCSDNKLMAQNSMVGDGFGGRDWYVPHNYQAGAYSAYTVCGDSNQLYGWGDNSFGYLGNGTYTSSNIPVAVTGMSNVVFYTTGYISSVIKNDNTAWVWGYYFPNVPVQLLSDVKFVDGGLTHVVFVKKNGTVWGAGGNASGELGNGSFLLPGISSPPVEMVGITNAVRAIAVEGTNTSAAGATIILLSDGTVKITGGGGWFQTTNSAVPVTMGGLSNIVDIKGNDLGAYALDSGGNVYSFGRDNIYNPVLGLGASTSSVISPTRITFPATAAPIIALSSNDDGYHCLALDSNRNVYAWGSNDFGQLGDGTLVAKLIPTLVATNVIDIFAGELFSYILKSDNSIWATGKSNSASIWMNLTNIGRQVFTQIDPTIPPMNLCEPKTFGLICPYKIKLGNDTTLCENQKLNLKTGISNAGYLWQDNSIDSVYTVSSPGTYSVTVSKFNCVMKDTINIYYSPIPIVSLGSDSLLCKPGKIDLHMAYAGATYLWQDNSTSQNYTITEPGTYWVNVNLNGCHNADTIVVKSKYCNCTQNVPNAITPNGDGINDKWILADRDCFRYVDVLVYNRYGNLVYEKKNYQNDWEGTYKSKSLPDGTYYYFIKATRFDGRIENLKGNLTILR